jgi:multiple sugar transport system substrate-binding protein
MVRHLIPRSRLTKTAGLVSAGVVLAATLAACGGSSDSDQSDADAKQTLTFLNAQDPGTFDSVIKSFEKSHPNIKIKKQTVPFDDLNSAIQSRIGGKDSSIDLVDVDEPRLASFAARGYLADLTDLRKGASIDDQAMKVTTYDGKQFAMPRWTSTQLLFFNKALLKKAGVALPSSDPGQPITWEQMAADGKKAQDKAGAKWGFTFDQVDRYYQLQPLPEGLQGGSGLTGKGNLSPDITNAAWVKAFSWYGKAFADGISPRGVAPEQTPDLFASGKTAFFAGGPWNVRTFGAAKGLDYGVAPYPKFAGGQPATSTDSWSIGVSAFSKHQAAAKEFIKYMTVDPEGAYASSYNNIPVQKDAFAKYLDDLRSKDQTQLATIIEGALADNPVHRPTTIGFVDFETVMNKAFADIRNGAAAKDRLEQASQELERTLKKYQGQ